jgi:hypothetical protein
MNIRNSSNSLVPLCLTNSHIHLRQRRRTECVVIIQQLQARDHSNRKTAFLERRRFGLEIFQRIRNADIDYN